MWGRRCNVCGNVSSDKEILAEKKKARKLSKKTSRKRQVSGDIKYLSMENYLSGIG